MLNIPTTQTIPIFGQSTARASSPAKHGGRGRKPLPYSRASDNPAAEFSAMVVRVSGGLCVFVSCIQFLRSLPIITPLPHSWLRHSMFFFSCLHCEALRCCRMLFSMHPTCPTVCVSSTSWAIAGPMARCN